MTRRLTDKLYKIWDRARKDYYFLCKEILGFSRMVPEHQEVCEMIEKPGKRKKLLLLPRGSFKSSIVTIGYTVLSLIRDPNKRILVASGTAKNAKKYVREIRTHFESNEKLKALFGEFFNFDNTWRDDEFIIKQRNRVFKEASVSSGSLERGIQTGMHYDVILLDDVVESLNTRTREQIEKTLEFYRLLLSVLEPDGKIIIVGTRWHFLDLYGTLLNPCNPDYSQFHTLVRGAYLEDGSLYLPTVLTEKFLQEQRATQGEFIFNHQYLNKATSASDQAFDRTWIKFFDKIPPGCTYYMSIDCAISMGRQADYTAIVVVAVDWQHNWYVVETFNKRCEPSETIDMLFYFNERYQPMFCLAMEKQMLEKFLKVNLLEQMEKRRKIIPIKEVETDTRCSKEIRIKSLQPRMQMGQLYLKADQLDLIGQIEMFPQVEHDDLVDALKNLQAVTTPAEKPATDNPEKTWDPKLSQAEKEIWKGLDKISKRRVVESGWF